MSNSPSKTPRPLIGLVAQTIPPITGVAPLSFAMGQQYVRAISAAGALPWIIPLLTDDEPTLREIFGRIDGLFLGGGADIDPVNYGDVRRECCGPSDPGRDAVEIKLLGWATERALPTFGICRGVQMINVAHGGTLYQDIGKERAPAEKHDYFPKQGFSNRAMIAHTVRIAPGTRLHGLIGGAVAVNSIHHQGIKELGDGLVPVAVAPDGVIEGIEGTNGRFLLGVQWHPEEMVPAHVVMTNLFRAFVEAASEFHRSRESRVQLA